MFLLTEVVLWRPGEIRGGGGVMDACVVYMPRPEAWLELGAMPAAEAVPAGPLFRRGRGPVRKSSLRKTTEES